MYIVGSYVYFLKPSPHKYKSDVSIVTKETDPKLYSIYEFDLKKQLTEKAKYEMERDLHNFTFDRY